MVDVWPTKPVAVASIQLDRKNPRLGRETTARAPRDIIQYLFEHDKAMEVADSIATRGYFPNEPLLVIKEDGKMVVVEGNRRLAALKALREPGLLDGAKQRQIERLAKRIHDPQSITKVPVTVAPSRRATDRQIAGRHIGTPVLAWQAENRASFILEKLEEGYTNQQLEAELGFGAADIQEARQTRAIADMARSIDLPDEVKAKLDNPRAKIFSTVARVFDSTVGRDHLHVEPDPDHGIRGRTTKAEFLKGFKKLVEDVALAKQSSRTLNSNEDIEDYFNSWESKDRPVTKRGTFVPSDIIKGKSAASGPAKPKTPPLNAAGDAPLAEPFAGGAGAALSLLYREEASEIFINDADIAVYDFWWTLCHRPAPFLQHISRSKVSIREWKRQRSIYRASTSSRLARGFAAFYLNRCNRSGIIMNAGPIGGIEQSGPWKIDARYNKDNLRRRCERVVEYRDRIHVSGLDGLEFIRKFRLQRIFFLIDPPYFEKGPTLYLNTLDPEYHQKLGRELKRLDQPWVLTYDDCPEIRKIYSGWAKVRPFALRYVASERRQGRELLIAPKWMRLPNTQRSAAIDW